ncbi:MAG: hypothetical protein AAB890_03295 [Patescibacteria group bacterium]
MTTQTITKDNITIRKETIQKNGGVVVLSLKEYEELRRQAMPTYYLSGKEAEAVDKLVKQGLRDYKAGKCKEIQSLANLD